MSRDHVLAAIPLLAPESGAQPNGFVSMVASAQSQPWARPLPGTAGMAPHVLANYKPGEVSSSIVLEESLR